MTAIALDDERPALEIIDAFCRRLEGVDLQRVFIKPAEARLYLMKTPVDLLFPDINMPGETGLGFIRSIAGQPLVIFTTAYSEYAVESYEVQAVDYLLKPFSCGRFEQAVQRAHHRQTSLNALAEPDKVEPTPVLFRADHGLVKVLPDEILFVKGLDNYLQIHLSGGRMLVLRLTLKALLDKLPGDNFIRVHRSYIVAPNKIDGVRPKRIGIGGSTVPIGDSYEKNFFTRFGA